MRGSPQRLGTRVAQLGVVAQASPGGIRVRQRDASCRLRLGVGRQAVVAASAAALLVLGGLPRGRGVRAQEHHEQHHPEGQCDDVERAEDHHQLLIRRHAERLPGHRGCKTAVRYHPQPPMATSDDTRVTLPLNARAAEGSRAVRRLRRIGQVPGVIYGGTTEPELFAVDARTLRNTLAHSGAILEVSVDGGGSAPVLVKDLQRHPLRGHAMHIDLLRVDMKVAIHTTVTLELIGADVAPGVGEGGVLSQGAVELNIEALPGDIPDSLVFDVSRMEMNATATLAELSPPPGVTLLDDPHETVLA